MNKVGNYGFLKLMSNNEMSTKENTLQLPTQFSSTSSSESESGTEYSNLKKQRKHPKKRKIKSLNVKLSQILVTKYDRSKCYQGNNCSF